MLKFGRRRIFAVKFPLQWIIHDIRQRDAMNMIGHDHKRVDFNAWIIGRQFVPNRPRHASGAIHMHFIKPGEAVVDPGKMKETDQGEKADQPRPRGIPSRPLHDA